MSNLADDKAPSALAEVAGLALMREVQAAFGRYRPAVAVTVANNIIAAVLVAMSDGDEARALAMCRRVTTDLRSIVRQKATLEREAREAVAKGGKNRRKP